MAAIRIETAELGLPAIDALEVDSLAVFVGPERPLQGLAGYADWRLCGRLSRLIREGIYQPEQGEALLLPSGGRLPIPRIFCFGLEAVPRDAVAYAGAVTRLCQAMHKVRSVAWAGSLPDAVPGTIPAAARMFLQAMLVAPVRRVVLLGDARTLHRDLLTAREALGSPDVDVVAPVSRVEMPNRSAGLPHPGAVVR